MARTKRTRRALNLPRVPSIMQTEKIHQPKAKARKVKHKARQRESDAS